MEKKEKILNAITSVFPTLESIVSFVEDSENRESLQSFIDMAFKHQLIEKNNEASFKAFVRRNTRPSVNGKLNGDMSLEKLIGNKTDFLNIRLSNRGLTENINTLLKKNEIKLPRLNNTMVTRLKKQIADTPRKRDALRSLAFWIGHERSEIGDDWHYETLNTLCSNKTLEGDHYRRGVRIAFAISSRGDSIKNEMVQWLKRTLKYMIKEKLSAVLPGSWTKLKYHDPTTLYIDIPNTDERSIPIVYGDHLRNAISVAYQTHIKWMVSGFANINCFLSIGIGAGDFTEINNHLIPILGAKLPQDPVIRLTDYARQCAVINEIKAVLNDRPKEMMLFNNETFNAWWIKELWSTLYWDLIPDLLGDDFLNKNRLNVLAYRQRFPLTHSDHSKSTPVDAITTFLQFPQYSTLGYEIARNLFCKKRFSEALEILIVLLRVNPTHITSRVTRMAIYRILGVEAMTYGLSDMMFRKADKEARYILDAIHQVGEDFYYEYAMVKLAQFSTAFKQLRDHGGSYDKENIRIDGNYLLALINEAEEILMQGMTVCLTVERIKYLFFCILVFKAVLLENITGKKKIPSRLTCPQSVIKNRILEYIISSGQLDQFVSGTEFEFNRFNQLLGDMLKSYEDKIALDIFYPTMLFANAVVYWDILPLRNVAIILETLNKLKLAIAYAERQATGDYIFSCIRMTGQLVHPEAFINQVHSIIKEIEKRYKTISELEKMAPTALVGDADDDLVLSTYFF